MNRDGAKQETTAGAWLDGVPWGTGWTLEEFADTIDVTPMSEPDPGWSHEDEAGHFHARSTDPMDHYPTLERRTRHVECDGSDVYMDSYLVCRICEEEVTPGTRAPVRRRSVRLVHEDGTTLFVMAVVVGIDCRRPVGDVVEVVVRMEGVTVLGRRGPS